MVTFDVPGAALVLTRRPIPSIRLVLLRGRTPTRTDSSTVSCAQPMETSSRSTFRAPRKPVPASINDARDVTGYYADTNGANHGFVRGPGGNITYLRCSGSRHSVRTQGTIPNGINADGRDRQDYYIDAQKIHYGFVRDANGVITTFSPPELTECARRDSGIRHQQSGNGYGILLLSDESGSHFHSRSQWRHYRIRGSRRRAEGHLSGLASTTQVP